MLTLPPLDTPVFPPAPPCIHYSTTFQKWVFRVVAKLNFEGFGSLSRRFGTCVATTSLLTGSHTHTSRSLVHHAFRRSCLPSQSLIFVQNSHNACPSFLVVRDISTCPTSKPSHSQYNTRGLFSLLPVPPSPPPKLYTRYGTTHADSTVYPPPPPLPSSETLYWVPYGPITLELPCTSVMVPGKSSPGAI